MPSETSGTTGLRAESPMNALVVGRDREAVSVVTGVINRELPHVKVYSANTPAKVLALMWGEIAFRFVVIVDDRNAHDPEPFPKGCVMDSLADVLHNGGILSEDFFVSLGYRVVGLREQNPRDGEMALIAATARDVELPEEFSRWRPLSVGIGLRIALSRRIAKKKPRAPHRKRRRGGRR